MSRPTERLTKRMPLTRNTARRWQALQSAMRWPDVLARCGRGRTHQRLHRRPPRSPSRTTGPQPAARLVLDVVLRLLCVGHHASSMPRTVFTAASTRFSVLPPPAPGGRPGARGQLRGAKVVVTVALKRRKLVRPVWLLYALALRHPPGALPLAAPGPRRLGARGGGRAVPP